MENTEKLKAALVRKLHPSGYSAMSNQMAAILGFLLDEDWTDPVLEDLIVTPDGHLLAKKRGDLTHQVFVGSKSDLTHNLANLLLVAGLTAEEETFFKDLVRRRIENPTEIPVI